MKKERSSRLSKDRSGHERVILSVPAYLLYGEEWTRSVFGFFHIETFSVRSAPNNWRIGLHGIPILTSFPSFSADDAHTSMMDRRLRLRCLPASTPPPTSCTGFPTNRARQDL